MNETFKQLRVGAESWLCTNVRSTFCTGRLSAGFIGNLTECSLRAGAKPSERGGAAVAAVPRQNSSKRERLAFLPVAGTLEPSYGIRATPGRHWRDTAPSLADSARKSRRKGNRRVNRCMQARLHIGTESGHGIFKHPLSRIAISARLNRRRPQREVFPWRKTRACSSPRRMREVRCTPAWMVSQMVEHLASFAFQLVLPFTVSRLFRKSWLATSRIPVRNRLSCRAFAMVANSNAITLGGEGQGPYGCGCVQ